MTREEVLNKIGTDKLDNLLRQCIVDRYIPVMIKRGGCCGCVGENCEIHEDMSYGVWIGRDRTFKEISYIILHDFKYYGYEVKYHERHCFIILTSNFYCLTNYNYNDILI